MRRTLSAVGGLPIPAALLLLLSVSAILPMVNAEDAIQYWTDYAINPKRCINYNGYDQIMYSMFEQSSNHCTDKPIGTYVAPVPAFVDAYLEQMADNAADAGQDDYVAPDAPDYVECTNKQINGVDYYLQIGCNDDDNTMLAVNIYSDEGCTQRSVVDGYDDANVELDLTVSFEKCTPCVVWMDKNDDEIDDMYFENKQTNAPLCSGMWDYREVCNGKCQVIGKSTAEREGWNAADKVLLSFLSLFGEYHIFLCIGESVGDTPNMN